MGRGIIGGGGNRDALCLEKKILATRIKGENVTCATAAAAAPGHNVQSEPIEALDYPQNNAEMHGSLLSGSLDRETVIHTV